MTAADRSEVRRAAKLLMKAESTDSREEAIALAARAYSLVAGWLNACEAESGTPRRRERRLLRDRRSVRRALQSVAPGEAPGPPVRGAAAYGRFDGDDKKPRSIDFRA